MAKRSRATSALTLLRGEQKQLLAQVERISRAIAVLAQGGATPSGVRASKPRKVQRRRKRMSPAARRAASKRMKKYWAERKRAETKGKSH